MPGTPLVITTILNGRVTQKLEFVKDRILLGRSTECDVRFENVGVSRVHAAITRQRSSYYFEDLRSSNGTTVNGQRVEKAELHNGDVVQIGKFTLHVTLAKAPPTAPLDCDDRTVKVSPSRLRADSPAVG